MKIASALLALALSLSGVVAHAQSRVTSTNTPSVAEPTVNEIINRGCPAGQALLGVTVERSSTKQATLKPRCRPIPQGSANEWCNASPPTNVACGCDGYEELGWKKLGTGCWACSGTGQKCPQPAQCSCVTGGRGAWLPYSCNSQGTLPTESSLAGRDATFDACFTVNSTGCTYQAIAGATCN